MPGYITDKLNFSIEETILQLAASLKSKESESPKVDRK